MSEVKEVKPFNPAKVAANSLVLTIPALFFTASAAYFQLIGAFFLPLNLILIPLSILFVLLLPIIFLIVIATGGSAAIITVPLLFVIPTLGLATNVLIFTIPAFVFTMIVQSNLRKLEGHEDELNETAQLYVAIAKKVTKITKIMNIVALATFYLY